MKLIRVTGLQMVQMSVTRKSLRGIADVCCDAVFVDERRLKRQWRRVARHIFDFNPGRRTVRDMLRPYK